MRKLDAGPKAIQPFGPDVGVPRWRRPMTMHSEHHGHGFVDSLGFQVTAAFVAIAVVVAIAWFTVF